MSNPYEDSSEDAEGASANAAALAEMRSDIESAKDSEEGNPSIEVGAPVHDEPEVEERLTGKAARRERGRQFKRDMESREAEKDAENARLREEMAEMRGRMDGLQRAQQAPPPGLDPWEDKIKQEQKARDETLSGYESAFAKYANLKQEMPADEKREWLNRNDAHTRNMVGIELDKRSAARDTPERRAHASLSALFPDVMNDRQAFAYATATFQQKDALSPIPAADRRRVTEEIMQETRQRFKMPGAMPPPSQKQETSYGQISRGGGPPKAGTRVRISPEEQRMAKEFYKHTDMTEAQMYQAFVNADAG